MGISAFVIWLNYSYLPRKGNLSEVKEDDTMVSSHKDIVRDKTS